MFRSLLEKLQAAANRQQPAHLQIARRGEQIAYDYLREAGYRIIARNYHPRRGHCEVDLIGWDADRLAIIEVKTRVGDGWAPPERAVDEDKRRKVIRAANNYALRAEIDPEKMRFDIVSIVLDSPPRIELFKAAFSPTERTKAKRNRESHHFAPAARNPQ